MLPRMFLAVFSTQSNVYVLPMLDCPQLITANILSPTALAYDQNQTARLEKKSIVSATMITIGAAGGVASILPYFVPKTLQ
jgi:hypothetical protein